MNTIQVKGGSSTNTAVGTALAGVRTNPVIFPVTQGHHAAAAAAVWVQGRDVCRRGANHMEVESHEPFDYGWAAAPS